MKNIIIKLIFVMVIILFFLWSYYAYNGQDENLLLYTKEPLKIGVIGEIPKVREDIIEFHQIQFKDIEDAKFNTEYDAIFIAKDNLSEAAKDKYATVYKTSKIPFFFLGTEKDTLPFTEENLSYEDAEFEDNHTIYSGILYKNTILGWSCSSNTKNPTMSAIDYSQVFQIIYEVKHSE